MSTHTILSILARENPTPIPWKIGPGPNTLVKEEIEFPGVKLWRAFNYANLRSIFRGVVEAPWRNPPAKTTWSRLDLTYGDENGFEHQILSRETVVTVNQALRHAQVVCKHPYQLHLGRRGRCTYEEDNRLTPDWTLIREETFREDGLFENMMPGDTKLSARWQPDLVMVNKEQWARPIKQLLSYSNDAQCRYGFLITDNELVVFQFARERVSPGIASTRPTRTPQASLTHNRIGSYDSELSSSVQAMSLTESYGAQSYVESGKGFDYQSPKCQIIPWTNKGKGVLTVRLALFYLCLMAGCGTADIQTWYPKLNTWHMRADGIFQHNTSGFTKKRLDPGDKVEDPTSEEYAGEDGGEVEDTGYENQGAAYPLLEEEEGEEEEEDDDDDDDESTEDEEGAGYPGGVYEGAAYPGEEEDDDDDQQQEAEEGGRAVEAEVKARANEGGNEIRREEPLPKLGSKKLVVEVKFERRKGTYFFRSRTGDKLEVKRREWTAMNYQGRSVMVYKGRKTNYIAAHLPI